MTTTTNAVRVLCVDDNRLVADAVAARLRQAGGFEVVGHLKTADDLLETVSRQQPDIILLDIDMPGIDPIDAAQSVFESGSIARVVVFSGYVRLEIFERAIRAGAWGYISKSDGENELIKGLREVAGDNFVMSPEVEAICERQCRDGNAENKNKDDLNPTSSRTALADEEFSAEAGTENVSADEVMYGDQDDA